ncbi:MAG: 3'-5' exonuclease, partial [Sulfuricella sp.]
RGMWIGTFHGLCNRLLRAHHREAGLPALFQILDSADQLGAIKRLIKALNVDDEKYPPKQLQHFINNAKDQGLRAKDVEAYDPYTRKQQELFAAYDEQCQREGVVDFAELLLRSYELLARDVALRTHYQSRFHHILVDEFQDTNHLQYLWLKQLAGPDVAVFAVGDDDQSIYAFRGARVGNMQDFERDFGVDKVIKLEQNYRSHGNILDAANALIRHNRGRLGKNLWTAESTGEPIRLYEAASDQEEAQFIVDEARALKREGVAFAQIALLYRSNAQSRVLEHALFNAGIPYRVHGGLRFFERQEIKHALAYLRLIGNTDDDGALMRVINFPARGIGARSLEQLQEIAKQNQSSLWQAAKSGQLSGKAGASIGAFTALIRAMQDTCVGLPLPEQIEHMLAHSGLVAHYQAEKDGVDRVDNLNELVNAAVGFVAESEDDSLVAFLTHAALEAGEHQAGEGSDALQLMTVHAAKGLEFHAVFLSGLEEGLFPHENAAQRSFSADLPAQQVSRNYNARNEPDGVEEERRLMYVAITRARRRLYLSLAQSRMLHGQFRYGLASRFLNEIPENLLKRINRAPKTYYAAQGDSDFLRPEGRERSYAAHPQGADNRAARPEPARPGAYGHSTIDSPWHIGQNVAHAKFGSGVIVNCEGRGADARVQVKFRNAGVKWLALEYAKLTAT